MFIIITQKYGLIKQSSFNRLYHLGLTDIFGRYFHHWKHVEFKKAIKFYWFAVSENENQVHYVNTNSKEVNLLRNRF